MAINLNILNFKNIEKEISTRIIEDSFSNIKVLRFGTDKKEER